MKYILTSQNNLILLKISALQADSPIVKFYKTIKSFHKVMALNSNPKTNGLAFLKIKRIPTIMNQNLKQCKLTLN